MAEQIIIYGKHGWPYTEKARSAYGDRAVYYDVKADKEKMAEMLKFSNGAEMVPVIVDGDKVTIGYGGTWGVWLLAVCQYCCKENMSHTMREFSPATIDSISFHNKAVEVIQKKAGYRFAIDAILLSDFVKVKADDKNIIDMGTGSGIIALLLAKCFPHIKITGIELQKGLFELAKESVRLNRLEAQVHIENIAIKDIKKRFRAETFNAVVTNPPYRRFKSGRINPTEEKAIARHEIKTNLEEIIKISSYLLKAKGSLFLIHLPERLAELIYQLKRCNIEPKRMRFVYSREGEDAAFVLMEGAKGSREGLKIERPLYIYDKSREYTDEMKRIYGKKKWTYLR